MSLTAGHTTLDRDSLSPSLTQRQPHDDVEAQSLLRPAPNSTASSGSVPSDWKRRPATFWSLALVLTVLPLTWYYWSEIPLLHQAGQHAVANFFTMPNSTSAFAWPQLTAQHSSTLDTASTPTPAPAAHPSGVDPASALSEWLALHDAAAVAADSDANLCGARSYLAYGCCGGNYGTTLMRVVAIVKLAIQLNRTVLLDMSLTHPHGGGLEASYFDWALPTEDHVRARLRRNGCEDHLFHTQYEYGLPETAIELPFDWQTEPQWVTNDTAICTDPNAPKVAEWYKHLRCSDLTSQPNPLLARVARVGGFDIWNWHQLLELNPYWLQSPLRHTFKHYQLGKRYHEEIFDALIKPSAGVQTVIDTFVHQDAIPQQTQRAYGPGWTGVVHFRTARPDENNPLTLVAVRELLKQLAPYNYSQALLPAKLPIMVSSAQIPSQKVCDMLLNNLTLALADMSLPETALGSQLVDCRFFDAHQYEQLHSPLPAGVSIEHVNFQPWDWGVEPSWAAVVNLFAVKQTRGFFVALDSSSFAAVMRLTSKVESFGMNGRLNGRAFWWPF